MMRHSLLAGLILGLGLGAGATAPVSEGMLQAVNKAGQPLGNCPLKHTDVAVDIAGFIARVTVEQQFENPFEDPIEAVYVFPLSEKGAVDRMTMKIGERVIKGVVKEREEARKIYEAARDAGQAASLLDQERPNIFTQSVANIMPGEAIRIEISYVEYLAYEDGEYTFSFPMVVGPRYVPGDTQGGGTDQVPDAGQITPPVAPKGQRAGHDIGLSVMLDAGTPLKEVRSELHAVEIERPEVQRAVVRLKNMAEIPNRDFVLKYQVEAKEITDAVLCHHDDQGGFFTLILHPPERVRPEEARPKELIFVIDCSGSMRAFPLDKAKKTMRRCIEQMNPKDSFNLISFAGGTGYCFKAPVENTEANREKALAYLDKLQGGGGTEMMKAIRAALGAPYAEDRLRMVCFMTDGFIGNDMAILDEIQRCRGSARVFAFGIGNGVNTFLIEGMGVEGRGASEIVTLESDGDAAAKRFHERVQSPVLTDISLDFGGLQVEEVYPKAEKIPDLFSAKPLIITGRYGKAGSGVITLRGKTAAGDFERAIDVTLPAVEKAQDVLAPLWARQAIDDLMAQNWRGMQQGRPGEKIKEAIIQLGVDFSLVTQFTSFVAVEEKVINEGGEVKRVEVPVELTDGVSHEGVFGGEWESLSLGAASGVAVGMSLQSKSMPRGYSKPAAARGTEQLEGLGYIDGASSPAPAPAPEPCTVSAEAAQDEIAADTTKLHPVLQGLAAKVKGGRYTDDHVTVQHGRVRVMIEFTEDADAATKAEGGLEAALQRLQAKVISMLRSSNKALVEIEVKALDRLTALKWVKFIRPAN